MLCKSDDIMEKSLYLYNTASRAKEKFERDRRSVGMYCCGPTVYNFAHIGNLRTYIFEDVLKRSLISMGYGVKHIVNITDVGHLTSDADSGEDRMEKGAAREGKTVWEIAAMYTGKFMENVRDLAIIEPDKWVKATDHIPQMIAMVRALEAKGFTYKTSDGIYFDTARYPKYCEFARLDPESLRAGERVDMGEKRTVTDFALWKFSPTDKLRQMEWDSPWGKGFPGWHIECSAMSLAYLPQPFDIHCGGQDHIRVHHTNEIAQSEAATGKQFARYWLHGEFLVIDKVKMAKSGENFVTLDTLKQKGVAPLAYRLFCYSAHYRSPLTFSMEGIAAAENSLVNLRKAMTADTEPVCSDRVQSRLDQFFTAVYDDLNMPQAMAVVWDTARDGSMKAGERRAFAGKADAILGLDLLRSESEEAQVVETVSGIKIKVYAATQLSEQMKLGLAEKIMERQKARATRDFRRADAIRDELVKQGISIKDLPDGTAECRIAGSSANKF